MATLVVMAAGLGSRYKSLKQMDGVGPNGELLMEYSLKDAAKAGFANVVVIVREDFKGRCKELLAPRWSGQVNLQFAAQELDMLPKGFRPPPGRVKPWGTGHALLACKEYLLEPFCIINADDYYGEETFVHMAEFLIQLEKHPYKQQAAMIAYPLRKTLSANGSVTRGLCRLSPDLLNLEAVVERKNIFMRGNRFIAINEDGTESELSGNASVSMNFWGFDRSIFSIIESEFEIFLNKWGEDLQREFLLPEVVNLLIQKELLSVRAIATSAEWFGMTYPQDKVLVANNLKSLSFK